ncbi:MAG: hemin uptake protein HemP [Pirellulaceae bacterium]|nr:hemin uptake protein HemP [Pirellulaceae bacterium]
MSDPDNSNQPTEIGSLSAETAAQLPKIVSFDTLSRCGDEIWIENNGQIYRLRRTKQGKLILTK